MKLVRVFQCACSRASRSRRSTGVVLGSSGREVRSVVLRSNAPIALCSDIGPMLLPTSGGGMSGTPKLIALCLKQTSEGWSNFIDYRSREGGLLLSNITSLVGLSPSVTGRTLHLSQGGSGLFLCCHGEQAGVPTGTPALSLALSSPVAEL